ncbi:hypothetical protein GEMRC1_002460 [Eukaryota sp. GEM-RC1]
MSSLGGFCISKHQQALDHQRLAALGYVFSASVPPYLASAASTSLKIVQSDEKLRTELGKKSEYLSELFGEVVGGCGHVGIGGAGKSPVKVVFGKDLDDEEEFLNKLRVFLLDNGVFTSIVLRPRVCLPVYVTIEHSYSDLETLSRLLFQGVRQVFV